MQVTVRTSAHRKPNANRSARQPNTSCGCEARKIPAASCDISGPFSSFVVWSKRLRLFLSILGADVFRRAGDIPVMIIFVGLALIYATEIPCSLVTCPFDDTLRSRAKLTRTILPMKPTSKNAKAII